LGDPVFRIWLSLFDNISHCIDEVFKKSSDGALSTRANISPRLACGLPDIHDMILSSYINLATMCAAWMREPCYVLHVPACGGFLTFWIFASPCR